MTKDHVVHDREGSSPFSRMIKKTSDLSEVFFHFWIISWIIAMKYNDLVAEFR